MSFYVPVMVDFVQALQQQVGQLKEEADSIPLAEKKSDHMDWSVNIQLM